MRWLRHPSFWILVQVVVLASLLVSTGRLSPHATPDTASYQNFPLDSLSAALGHARTFGYPLFFRAASGLTSQCNAVPSCQLAAHVVAVAIFYLGVCRLLDSEWSAFAAASPLLYSNIVLGYVDNLIADSLASSVSVATVGLLFWVVSGVRSVWLWLALSASCFATYQIRPAFLFLVLLLPIAGVLLCWMRSRTDSRVSSDYRRLGSKLAVCGLLPLLGYCGFRWLLVGHFALVSFGGNNFAGTIGVFLTPSMVSELPRDLRPLAHVAIQNRNKLAARDPEYSSEPTLEYMEIENRFDFNTWQVFVPAAQHFYGDDQLRVNASLRRLAVAIIWCRPGDYAIWLAKAAWRGICVTLLDLAQNPVYLAMLAGLLVVHARLVVRRLRLAPEARSALLEDSRDSHFAFNALLLFAMLFAGMKLLLIITTTPPLGRFMDAAGVFFPAVLGITVIDHWKKLQTSEKRLSP